MVDYGALAGNTKRGTLISALAKRLGSIEEEDAKRPNREREKFVGERTRAVNRIKATLARLGIRTLSARMSPSGSLP
jgi:hypothetical protein